MRRVAFAWTRSRRPTGRCCARGFLERDSEYYVFLRDGLLEDPGIDGWQILPGDHDAP
jgi:hypothetical protein